MTVSEDVSLIEHYDHYEFFSIDFPVSHVCLLKCSVFRKACLGRIVGAIMMG